MLASLFVSVEQKWFVDEMLVRSIQEAVWLSSIFSSLSRLVISIENRMKMLTQFNIFRSHDAKKKPIY